MHLSATAKTAAACCMAHTEIERKIKGNCWRSMHYRSKEPTFTLYIKLNFNVAICRSVRDIYLLLPA